MQLQSQGDSLLIVSENGLGKRTYLEEFSVQNRGGKGVKCYKITEKTGNVVGVKAVTDENEIMMITTEGIIIQLRMQDISTLGRITSGVKMMDLEEGVKIAKIAKVREKLSNGEQEFDNLEDAMEKMGEEENLSGNISNISKENILEESILEESIPEQDSMEDDII